MADALTQRQREILDFISSSIVERGFPPTLREIGEHFNIRSTNGVNDHLKALEKKGHLRREDLKSRAMRPVLPDGGDIIPMRRSAMGTGDVQLVTTDEDMAEIPILGKVAAGQPILAVEMATDTVKIDRMLLGGHREVFGLRIVGESMIEDGIFDGDLIVVQPGERVENGQVAVVLLHDDTATLKRVYLDREGVRLQPANSTMQPMVVPSVRVRGRVTGLIRRYD